MEILPIPNKQIEPYTFLILFIPEHAQRFVYTVRARLLDLSMPMQAEFLCLPEDGKINHWVTMRRSKRRNFGPTDLIAFPTLCQDSIPLPKFFSQDVRRKSA